MKNRKKKRISLVQLLLMVFCALTVGGAITFGAVKSVFGAAVPNFSYSGLSAEDSGTSWSYTTSSTTFSGSATGTSGTCGGASTATSSTLTIKNVTGVDGTTLSLTFAKSGNGTFKINGSAGSAGTSSYTLANNGTVTVNVTSEKKASATTTVTVKINSFVVPSADKTTHFDPAPNGKYTIKKGDGSQVTCSNSRVSITQSQALDFTITSLPNSGYRLVEWLKNNSTISTTSSFTFKGSDDGAVYKPVFTESSNATFLVGSTKYFALDQAINAAQSGSDKVIKTVQSGSVKSGNYTIPNKVTLLLPFDAANTLYTSTPTVVYNSYTKPSAFSTLTLESGVTLIVSSGGAISLSAKLSAKGQTSGANGITTDKYGCIKFNHNDSSLSRPVIDVKSGGNLYAWGYIYGDGDIFMRNGSTVYECFEIRDWRGGTATSNKNSYSFPFNQYHIENIESNLYLFDGAVEKLYSSVNASSSAYPVSVDFIGSNKSMFRFTDSPEAIEANNTQYILKYYDSSKDQLFVKCYANASLSSLTVSGLPMIGSIVSDEYTLPISNNISISVLSGFTIHVTGQEFMMLPGSEIIIENGGRLDILSGAGLNLIDATEWCGKNLAGSGDYIPSNYSPTRANGFKYTVAGVDAKLQVNGLFYIYGKLYVSTSGANICCDEGVIGKFAYENGNTSVNPGTLYEMAGTSTSGKTAIAMSIAWFKNSDGSYFKYADYLNGEGVDKSKMQMIDYGEEDGVWKWGGKSTEGITSTIRFSDPLYPSFDNMTIDLLTSSSFTFFTTETIAQYLEDNYSGEYPTGIFTRGNKKIQYWRVGLTNLYYKAGFTLDPIGVLAETLTPVWEGWIRNDTEYKYLMPTTDISTESYAKGLYNAKTFVSDSDDEYIFKFRGSGIFDNSFTGIYDYVNEDGITNGDNQKYYIVGGVVQENYGLYRDELGTYYYFGEANYAYRNGIYRITNTNGLLENQNPIQPGYYYFDENGVMDISHTHSGAKEKPTSIHDGVAYVTYDSEVADNYGLFAYNNNLYYAGADGVLVTSTSFYVSASMINGCTIGGTTVVEGLYYFDELGRMYDHQLNLITNGGQSV